MKQALILAMVITAVCVGMGLLLRPAQSGGEEGLPVTEPQTVTEPSPEAVGILDEAVHLRVLMEDGTVQTMSLSQYLPGVLLAEMPTSFAPEAQKAQAVVSRTYALHRRSGNKHEGADICASAQCCQGWKDPASCSQEAVLAAREAVHQTDGLVLIYQNRLIDATFFSSSGGRTEAAVAVWGSDIPYLQAVDSPGEAAPHNEDTVTFSQDAFAALIRDAAPEAVLTGPAVFWFGEVSRTEGGGVDQMQIGGVSFSGKTLRGLLGLRSTAFAVEAVGDQILIHTQGYGHRVGMSQYGAEAMAEEGKNFQDILNHYYTDVSLNYYIEATDFQ